MSLLAAREAHEAVRTLEVALDAARDRRAAELARAHAAGHSYSELAQELGLRRATVIDIVRRGRENR